MQKLGKKIKIDQNSATYQKTKDIMSWCRVKSGEKSDESSSPGNFLHNYTSGSCTRSKLELLHYRVVERGDREQYKLPLFGVHLA